MALKRTSSGVLLLVVMAAVGYLLVTLPPRVLEIYEQASGLGEPWGTAYLVAVAIGALLLVTVLVWIVGRVLLNTRRKAKRRKRRAADPSRLTRTEQEQELAENVQSGGAMADENDVSDSLGTEIRKAVAAIEAKRESQKLEIVAFGTISSGKSSLLNALAGRDVFASEVTGGTTKMRSEIPWPGSDRVVLTDTPGLAEVRGETRAAEAAAAAQDADLVLAVVDGPLKAYELDLLGRLGEMEKRILVCVNKADWFSHEERASLLGQIIEQVAPQVASEDVVAVQANPSVRRRMRVLPDGSEAEETVEATSDIEPLATRMLDIIERDGRDLLLANLLLQSRGLVEDAKRRVMASLDARADETVSKYMWAAGSAAAVNPIPLLDLAGGSAVTVKMVLELAKVYRQEIDVDTVVHLLSQLGKNLVAMLGATAATPAVSAAAASLMKTVPGVGTIAGGLLQGLVQALITRWIGKVFCEYYRNEMKEPVGGLAEVAREKWKEVTRPDQLRKLIQAGREHLKSQSQD